jgi:pimeloyl-ACP methyl ester carboxylesterase
MKKFLFAILLLLASLNVAYAQPFKTAEELADPDGAFADVNGVSVYYHAQGDETNPTVILIHGFGGSTFTWRDTLPALEDAGFYAIALDLPPFGLSDKDPDLGYSRSWMSDLVADFMDTLGIETATIVGHSMGGAVTAQFAVRHPEKVEKLVFVAGGVFEVMETEESEDESSSPLNFLNSIDPKAPAAPILLRTLVTKDFFIDTLASAYYDPSIVTEEVADGYAKLLEIEEAPIGFLAYVQAQETEPISLDDLANATQETPVLLMWGIEDTWVEIALGETMLASLTNAELVTYDLVGHLPMEENTEAFNADLIAFLEG